MYQAFKVDSNYSVNITQPNYLHISSCCDQCSRSKLNCNRAQPICSQCKKSKTACTFIRKTKKLREPNTQEKKPALKSCHRKSDMKNDYSGSPRKDNGCIIFITSTNSDKQTKLTKKQSSYSIKAKKSHISDCSSISQLKTPISVLYNLLTLLQCPTMESLIKLPYSTMLFNSVKQFLSCRGNNSPIVYPSSFFGLNDNIKSTICANAIQLFIFNSGFIGAVCTPLTLKLIPRSSLFLNTILFIGLARMPQDNITEFYCQLLEYELQEQVKKFLRLPTTFDTLQSLVLIYCHFSLYSWTRKYCRVILYYCLRLSLLFGLQYNSPQLPFSSQIERRLTYTTLMHLVAFHGLTSCPMLFRPAFSTSRRTFPKVMKHISNSIGLGSHHHNYLFFKSIVAFNNFINEHTALIFEVTSLKEKFCSGASLSTLEKKMSSLTQKIASNSCQAKYFLTHIEIQNTQFSLFPFLIDCKSTVSLFAHFLRFVTFTLPLYKTSKQSNSEQDQKYIQAAIIESHQVLIYATNISNLRLTTHFISMVSQSLIFLLRHHQFILSQKVKDDCYNTMIWFQTKMMDSLNGHFSQYNLNLISIVKEVYRGVSQ